MDLHRPSGILAAPPLAGVSVKPPFSPHPRASPERRPAALPAALAFLTVHGVSPAVLLTAAVEARRQAIAPEAAALANGTIRESFFYRCLAHQLGAAFIDGEIALGAGARYPHAIHAGLAPLDGGDGSRWLAARSVAYPSLGKGARRRALGRAPCDHDTFAFVELGGRGGDRVDPARGKPRPRQPRSESFRERTP